MRYPYIVIGDNKTLKNQIKNMIFCKTRILLIFSVCIINKALIIVF